MTTAMQTRAIHAVRRQTGMTDADYRGLLQARFSCASSSALTDTQARKLIDELKRLAGQTANAAPSKDKATGPYAPVLQALWLAAFNLGLTRSRHDAAMMKFVARVTGVDHTRFLTDAALASKAIEGLKKWIARDGGVVWPEPSGDSLPRKRAVFDAIARKAVASGAFTPFVPGKLTDSDFYAYGQRFGCPLGGFDYYTAKDWDTICNRLGAKLRARLAEQARG